MQRSVWSPLRPDNFIAGFAGLAAALFDIPLWLALIAGITAGLCVQALWDET